MKRLGSFLNDESGQDLIEYALLASFIAIVSVAALGTLGQTLKAAYEMIESHF